MKERGDGTRDFDSDVFYSCVLLVCFLVSEALPQSLNFGDGTVESQD